MSVVRLKNRPVPVQPTLGEFVGPARNLSRNQKRKKNKKDDKSDEMLASLGRSIDESLDPCFTQSRYLEKVEMSAETDIRKELNPSYVDRVEIYNAWLVENKKRMRVIASTERKKRLWELRKRKLEAEKAGKDKLGNSFSILAVTGSTKNQENADEEQDLQQLQEFESDSESEEDEISKAAVFIREKKVLKLRRSYLAHAPVGAFPKIKTAIALTFSLGWRSKVVTPVLPWLYTGDSSISGNMPLLLKLGITHILNLSYEVLIICIFINYEDTY